jgi:hypothetical protein
MFIFLWIVFYSLSGLWAESILTNLAAFAVYSYVYPLITALDPFNY